MSLRITSTAVVITTLLIVAACSNTEGNSDSFSTAPRGGAAESNNSNGATAIHAGVGATFVVNDPPLDCLLQYAHTPHTWHSLPGVGLKPNPNPCS